MRLRTRWGTGIEGNAGVAYSCLPYEASLEKPTDPYIITLHARHNNLWLNPLFLLMFYLLNVLLLWFWFANVGTY